MKPAISLVCISLFCGQAAAYCAESGRSAFASEIANGVEIPVYIVTSGVWSVLPDSAKTDGSRGTNMSWYEVYGAVTTAIARWNSVHKANFRYGGTATTPPYFPPDPPFTAQLQPNNAVFIISPMWCHYGCQGVACEVPTDLAGVKNSVIRLRPAGSGIMEGSCTQQADPYADKQWTNVRPYSTTQYQDLIDTLVHELGHTLGLLHPDDDNDPACDLYDGDHDPDLHATMNGGSVGQRRPLRDDLEGLDDLWGNSRWDPVAFYTTSTTYGSWGSVSVEGTDSAVPFAASSGHLYSYDIARVSNHYSSRFVRGVDDGSYYYPSFARTGISFQRPAVAYGEPNTLMTAWVEHYDQTDNLLNVRVRSRVNGTWSQVQVAMQTENPEIGLGYDEDSDRFLLSFIQSFNSTDAEPRIASLNHQGQLLSNTNLASTLGHVTSIGKVACDRDGDCVFPFSDASVYWPRFGLVRGHVSSNSFIVDQVRVLGYRTTTYVDVGMGDDDLFSSSNNDTILFSFTNSVSTSQGVPIWWVGKVDGFNGTPSFDTFATARTPLSIATKRRTSSTNPMEYRVYHGIPF